MRSLAEAPSLSFVRSIRARIALASAAAVFALAGHAVAQSSGPYCPLPAADDVVAVALRASGASQLDADALIRRSRRSAWLPESARVELRAAEDDYLRTESRLDQDFDELFIADGVDLTDLDRTGTSNLMEARVVFVWDLSRLAWSDRELLIERAAREARTERSRVTEVVLDLYFDWLVARTRVLTDEARRDAAAREEAQSRAHLDVLTAGWFSRALACDPRVGEAP